MLTSNKLYPKYDVTVPGTWYILNICVLNEREGERKREKEGRREERRRKEGRKNKCAQEKVGWYRLPTTYITK